MKGIRLLMVASLSAAFVFASAAEKPPTWLVGTFKGHDRYLSADVILHISANGQISETIDEKNGKKPDISGRYHMKRLFIGKRIYDIRQTSDGLEMINIWRMPERVDLVRQ